jgi:GH24 family phage-related lysozyme (muramidase)
MPGRSMNTTMAERLGYGFASVLYWTGAGRFTKTWLRRYLSLHIGIALVALAAYLRENVF